MKVFNEEKAKKSWALRLEQIGNNVNLRAVDAKTGEAICTFISFREAGVVSCFTGSLQALDESGYDPFEHGNKFETASGKIVIT